MTYIRYRTLRSYRHLADMSILHTFDSNMIWCCQCEKFIHKDHFNVKCPKGGSRIEITGTEPRKVMREQLKEEPRNLDEILVMKRR